MKLSVQEIQKILKSPSNEKLIQEGRKYESSLRLLTETKFKAEIEIESSWKEFNEFMKSILSIKKFEKIKSFTRLPLSVVDISESCINELYKVFDARNSYFHIEFKNIQGSELTKKMLNDNEVINWITTKGKEVIKNKPNSIVVVDKNKEGKPYPILIESSRLKDFMLKRGTEGELEYIIFLHSTEKTATDTILRYAVYDDEYYRVFVQSKNSEFIMESEFKHTAGSCPARMFMSDILNHENEYNRKIPFSNTITKLQEWQVFDIYKFYADHYASFPVIEAPEDNCSIDACNNGIIETETEYYEGEIRHARMQYTDCPVCKSKDLIGPGTVVRVKAKGDKDDPSEAGVFRFVSNPVENLNYIKEKLEDIETHIVMKTVGLNQMTTDQAVNETQVKGSFESKQNVLIDLKSNLDKIYKWTIETMIRLINDKTEFNVQVNFGTEFYLLSEGDIQSLYENAIKIGLPESEIDMIYNQLIETKYKGNAQKIERLKIIKQLDPLPYKTVDQSIVLNEKNIISTDDLILKVGIVKFVERFEREQAPLTDFGAGLEFDQKIKKIKEIIKLYINEQKTAQGSGEQA